MTGSNVGASNATPHSSHDFEFVTDKSEDNTRGGVNSRELGGEGRGSKGVWSARRTRGNLGPWIYTRPNETLRSPPHLTSSSLFSLVGVSLGSQNFRCNVGDGGLTGLGFTSHQIRPFNRASTLALSSEPLRLLESTAGVGCVCSYASVDPEPSIFQNHRREPPNCVRGFKQSFIETSKNGQTCSQTSCLDDSILHRNVKKSFFDVSMKD